MSKSPTILTATKTGKTPRTMFLPGILAWINDRSPAKLAYKSRRVGWTYGEAYDVVSSRERPTNPRDCDYWFSSADQEAGLEFIEYCRFWKKDLFGGVADYFTTEIEDPTTGRLGTAHVIRCRNKKRITAMTANPRRFRSKGGDVGLDEFGHHDQPGLMFDAAQPVATWGGSLRVFGTPNGEGAELHKLAIRSEKVLRAMGHDPHATTHCGVPYDVLAAKADEMNIRPVMSYHRMTILQATEQGLVELLNRVRGTKWSRPDFLAHLRRQCRNDEAWQQEYLCTPTMNAAAALKYHVIEGVMNDDCPAPVSGFENLSAALAVLREHYTGGLLFVGMDVGRTQDLSVIWVFEPVGDVLWTRLIYRMANTSLVDQEQALERILTVGRLGRCAVLKKGIGQGVYDHTARRFGEPRIVGIDESNAVKIGLVTGVIQAYEDRRVRIPADDGLKEQLHKVREERTPGGAVTYGAPRDAEGHADEFFAGAAAIDVAGSGAEPIEVMAGPELVSAGARGW